VQLLSMFIAYYALCRATTGRTSWHMPQKQHSNTSFTFCPLLDALDILLCSPCMFSGCCATSDTSATTADICNWIKLVLRFGCSRHCYTSRAPFRIAQNCYGALTTEPCAHPKNALAALRAVALAENGALKSFFLFIRLIHET
jgi:hypothetical protein